MTTHSIQPTARAAGETRVSPAVRGGRSRLPMAGRRDARRRSMTGRRRWWIETG